MREPGERWGPTNRKAGVGGAWLPPYTGYYTGYVVDRGCVDLYRNFYKDLLKLQYERMTVGEREREIKV